MLGSIRKFSTSIYAKILLGIVIIPFVFWGMGSSFNTGNKNIIVIIDKEKYSVQEFYKYLQLAGSSQRDISVDQIDSLLANFIGEKILEKEVEYFNIKLSDSSLSKLIKHQKEFKREGSFSRTEYEKFLLQSNITASNFESNLSKLEKKKQLLDFIGGGLVPSEFLVNILFDRINQKRNIELIDLNVVFDKKINFTDDEIKSYFNSNKDKYKEIYKSFKYLELSPKILVGSDEFTNSYFTKIDEIDDMIVQGRDIDSILKNFNLQKLEIYNTNQLGKNKNSKKIENLPKGLIEKIFNTDELEPTSLIEIDEKYFIFEITKTESIQRNIQENSLRKEILSKLKEIDKRKMLSELIAQINNMSFGKSDFDKLSINENVKIKKIMIDSINDDKFLKKDLINQIYTFSENKVVIVHDLNFSEIFLIYVDTIKNVQIDKKSESYKKYESLYKVKTTSELYNTYDLYIKNKYEIDINYQTLNIVKNNFIN